jgi:bifunctional UDP-N-acetylglucosamine pyrophosphorylase/glucosamine-1-phosphate N-acetyltransferase
MLVNGQKIQMPQSELRLLRCYNHGWLDGPKILFAGLIKSELICRFRGMDMDNLAGVVLAAGQGKRMNSRIPKVLHRACGKELVRYSVELLQTVGVSRLIVVVSPDNQAAVKQLLGDAVDYAVQPEPLGTADAVARCAAALEGNAEHVLVIGGDTPLVTNESVLRLLSDHSNRSRQMGLLTVTGSQLKDLGRVIKKDNRVLKIVEAVDASRTSDEVSDEVNVGVYCFEAQWLWPAVKRVKTSPGGELYITDLAAIGATDGAVVFATDAGDPAEALGINDRVQLAQAESVLRQRVRERWMLAGVTITDPASVFIDSDVTIGADTTLLPNTMLLGKTSIGENCEIGPGSIIRDSQVGDNCRATASMLEESTMEEGVDIGPFSHLRPGAYLETGVHIGNFVEVKESRFATGSVMGHFGYVGDASIGSQVNVGAGMVTCNYDGKDKHRTVIEERAFIGCDTMLVAPVTVGHDAVTGAGSVITKDVPPARLAVGVPAKIKGEIKKTG